jgi:hypothetical protein
MIDGANFACFELLANFLATGAPGDKFAPRLRGQGVLRIGRLVPIAALAYVVHSGRDALGKFFVHSLEHGGVDVTLRVILEKPPDGVVTLEGDAARFSRHAEDGRNDRALADVSGDVLFGVVGPHFFLVDVFFEDVAEYVGVDFPTGPRGPIVQVPVVLLEELKSALERSILDFNGSTVLL